jgi:hypothetical protein
MNERHKADSAGKLQVKDRPPAGRAIKMRYAEVNGIKIAFDIRRRRGGFLREFCGKYRLHSSIDLNPPMS